MKKMVRNKDQREEDENRRIFIHCGSILSMEEQRDHNPFMDVSHELNRLNHCITNASI